MKLEDWLMQKIAELGNSKLLNPDYYDNIPKGLHVIGTCGECKFYQGENKHYEVTCLFEGSDLNTKPDFGCIHFDLKEKK